MQPEIWIGTVEISFANLDAPEAMKPAFTVVTTWATSSEEFRQKCSRMLESYGWKLLGVERLIPYKSAASSATKWKTCWKEPDVIQTPLFMEHFIHTR